MQFQAEIIDVSPPVNTPNDKGGYNSIDVAYKQDGNVKGKKIIDVFNRGVYGTLSKLKRGDVITVTQEKKGEFWIWTAVTTGGQIAAMATSGDKPAPSATSAGRVVGSTYETPEERKIKQRNITRQFAINAAQNFCNNSKQVKADNLETLFAIAEDIVKFVYEEGPAQGVIDMQDDIPL